MLQTLLGSHPSDRCHPSPEPVGDHSLTSRVGLASSPAPLHPAGPRGTHKHQHVEDEHQVLHTAQDTHGDAEGTGFCRQTAAFVPAEGGAEPWPQPAPTCPTPWLQWDTGWSSTRPQKGQTGTSAERGNQFLVGSPMPSSSGQGLLCPWAAAAKCRKELGQQQPYTWRGFALPQLVPGA